MLRIYKSKKSMVFIVGLVIVTFILLTMLYVKVTSKQKTLALTQALGGKQLKIISLYQQGEKIKLFYDLAADYALRQTAYDLARNGGFYGESPCGNNYGYQLWTNSTATCFPDIDKELSTRLNENLESYIRLYSLPPLMYSFIYTDHDVLGFAKNRLMISQEGDAITVAETSVSLATPSGKPSSFISSQCVPPDDLVDISGFVKCSSGDSCKLREEAAKALKYAVSLARQKGYELIVTSSYRPYEKQLQYWLNGPPGHPEYARNRHYVAFPDCNSPHVSGGAVDVLLLKDNSALDFGSKPPSSMDNPNRKLLENIMISAGFVRYANEYWHYEYGTERWARAKSQNKEVIT